jgi:hypothetical protein
MHWGTINALGNQWLIALGNQWLLDNQIICLLMTLTKHVIKMQAEIAVELFRAEPPPPNFSIFQNGVN